MAAQLCENDVGTNLDFTVQDENDAVVDLTGATVTYVLEFPSGRIKSLSGSVQDAANGIARYTLQAGDISEAGCLKIQLQLIIGGWTGCSTIHETTVLQQLVAN